MKLYPLKFKPLLKKKVWGGDKIKNFYRHDSKMNCGVGESWDVVTIDEKNDSVVDNGYLESNTLSELIEVYMGELMGDKIYDKYGCWFPLIVKLIDASDNLSIQVHPDDEMAERHGEFGGKNEMWYVVAADEGAQVMLGFNREVSQQEMAERCKNGTIEEVMEHFNVRKGDVFYIPAGTVHALGKGCMVVEVQDASDVTYRLYDYNRLDGGHKRKLNVREGLESIDYEHWQGRKVGVREELNSIVNLVDNDRFRVNLIDIDTEREYAAEDAESCVVLTVVEGHVTMVFDGDYLTIADGESVLIPADMEWVVLKPTVRTKILETSIH